MSSRYEHASPIMTTNMPFARWGDVFGDMTIASAMIYRIVHRAYAPKPGNYTATRDATF